MKKVVTLKNVHEIYDQILSNAITDRLSYLMELLSSDELNWDVYCIAYEEVTIWKCFLREFDYDIPLNIKSALLHY